MEELLDWDNIKDKCKHSVQNQKNPISLDEDIVNLFGEEFLQNKAYIWNK